VLIGARVRKENLAVREEPSMKTYNTPLCKRLVIALLTAGALGLICPPLPAQAAEREGATLFFSFAVLKVALRFSPLRLFPPGTASNFLPDWHEKDSRVEKNFRWGNGLGVDGYATPGTRRPLWGY
jgi:hypothetical protein